MSKPRLISFNVCPFVQRSVILMQEKGVEYDIEFIDVYNPPEWFLEISPTGKVPVLQVGDEVLFESAVISEYLDEVYPPSLHPADPLTKAKNRAWIEYSSGLYSGTFQLLMAKTKEDADKVIAEMIKNLEGFQKAKQAEPWFNGEAFSLVDIASAPFFIRAEFFKTHFQVDVLKDFPVLQQWSALVRERQSVKDSIVDGFEELLKKRMVANESYLTQD
ncbi:glutathione S-transferase family protein [Cocleimonas flava]|uniref:glutathione transferase n=1 Tax=Cocleimonas flava TaxID=634765 RepID=A0A4R1F9Z3_9GAMM|nr:glutathione S-transferase family protein [Cocleimonas flava]TCJ88708.1 glutathione S-transferase [Cocleimonas flava]